jgi:hypothetical protein
MLLCDFVSNCWFNEKQVIEKKSHFTFVAIAGDGVHRAYSPVAVRRNEAVSPGSVTSETRFDKRFDGFEFCQTARYHLN